MGARGVCRGVFEVLAHALHDEGYLDRQEAFMRSICTKLTTTTSASMSRPTRSRPTDDEPTGAHLGQRQFTAATYRSTRLKQVIGVHAALDALSGRACMKYNDR